MMMMMMQVIDGVRLSEVPGREIACVVDRPGLRSIRDRLARIQGGHKYLLDRQKKQFDAHI